MPDGSKKSNFINLNIENFRITERGDLQDIVDSQNGDSIGVIENDSDVIPVAMTI